MGAISAPITKVIASMVFMDYLSEISKLYLAQQNQNQNYQQHQSDTAAGAITPVAAVTPGRNHTHKRQHQHNQKNHSDTHFESPCFNFATALARGNRREKQRSFQ